MPRRCLVVHFPISIGTWYRMMSSSPLSLHERMYLRKEPPTTQHLSLCYISASRNSAIVRSFVPHRSNVCCSQMLRSSCENIINSLKYIGRLFCWRKNARTSRCNVCDKVGDCDTGTSVWKHHYNEIACRFILHVYTALFSLISFAHGSTFEHHVLVMNRF